MTSCVCGTGANEAITRSVCDTPDQRDHDDQHAWDFIPACNAYPCDAELTGPW